MSFFSRFGSIIKSKYFLIFTLFFVVLVSVFAFFLFKPQSNFGSNNKTKYLYINTQQHHQRQLLLYSLDTNKMVKNIAWFKFFADKFNLWSKLKPGRYDIKSGMSIYEIINKLKIGEQAPVSFVINKIRSIEQLASLYGNLLENDSADLINYISSTDLQEKYNLNDPSFLSYIIPNTYYIFWDTHPEEFIERMIEENKRFWNLKRLQKASLLKLTPLQITSLASIVEEETLKQDEKPIIASVYLNRLNKKMKLEADPTIKFCMQNFGLRRITFKYINEEKECLYNTYSHYGLPPGPICTPSISSIEAVLNASNTPYIYFCARPERDGYHTFATTYNQHLENARKFHRMLNTNKIR